MIGLPYPGAAPPRHRDGHGPPPRAPRRGRGVDVRLRPDRLRPAPHRARAVQPRLRRPAALPALHRAEGARTCPTSPTSTTTSSSAPPSSGRTEADVATEFEARWWESMDALGDLRPQDIPHATQYIEDMVALVGQLVADGEGVRDARRRLPGGLDSRGVRPAGATVAGVLADRGTGRGQRGQALAPRLRPVEEGEGGRAELGRHRGGRADPGGTPNAWSCRSICWARGSTCTAAGQDLKFPHHENERAQAVADGKVFARHWMHHGWVEVGSTKMSKSLGNFTTLPDLLARCDARAYRVLVLRAHYRSPIEVTPETLADAEKALGRLDGLARRFDVGRAPRTDRWGVRGRGDAARHRRRPRRVGRLPGAHGRRPRHARGRWPASSSS